MKSRSMIPRLTFLVLLILSLALGPVRGVAACGGKSDAVQCHACCAGPTATCCAENCASAPVMPLVQTPPSADEIRQMLPPALTVLGFSPAPVVEPPATHKRLAARMPVAPRLDLICVRLI